MGSKTLDIMKRCLSEIPEGIIFDKKKFVITGSSHKCGREELTELLNKYGGKVFGSVSATTDYLIVCQGESDGWKYSDYGKKVDRAIELNEQGNSIVIVHENVIHEHLARAKEPEYNFHEIFDDITLAFERKLFTNQELKLLKVIADSVKSRS